MIKEKVNSMTLNDDFTKSSIRVEFYFDSKCQAEDVELSKCLIAAFFESQNINCIERSKSQLIFEDSKEKYINVFIALSDLRYDELAISNLKEAYIYFDKKDDLLNDFLKKDSPYQFGLEQIFM